MMLGALWGPRVLLGSVLALALTLPALASRAEGRDDPAWIPALKLGFDLLSTEGEGTLANTIRDPDADISELNADCSGVCVLSDSGTIRTAILSVGLELAGPALLEGSGGPRPFVHGGYQFWRIKDAFDIAREGDPKAEIEPPSVFNPNLILPVDMKGQGTLIQYVSDGSWWAGVGVSWPISPGWLEQPIWIKPSLDYFGMSGTVRGRVKHVTGERGDLENFQIIDATAEESTTYHGLGPRLGLDVELTRLGRVGVNMYFEVMAYWLLSDRETRFAASYPEGDLAVDFEMDEIVLGGGAGLRLSWLGWRGD
jgi:hypothetical protein